MDVNEHERRSNITQIKGKEHSLLIAVLDFSHSRVVVQIIFCSE
jgi:hypothetical protein